MSYKGGWKAINLEFTDRIPRTEYSAESYHWPLIQAVTGIDTSREENREKAKKEFVKRWDYAFLWMTPTGTEIIHNSGRSTRMGHAEYASQGEDFSLSFKIQKCTKYDDAFLYQNNQILSKTCRGSIHRTRP